MRRGIMANDLFLAYLPSNGKIPLLSVKDKSNWLEEPPEISDYCGVLNPKYLQLDFDSQDDSDIALKIVKDYQIRCDVLKTDRGVHIYMKDDGSIKSQSVDVFNAIGLKVDVGLGSKNRVVPLRTTKTKDRTVIVNGVEVKDTTRVTTTREFLQTYDELEEIPAFFKPIGTKDYGFKTTTTRNDTLYRYILQLQSKGFTKEETRKTIKIINNFVLYEPLDDKEIDTITRDDAFSKELFFAEKGGFLHDRFGDYMLSNSNIMNIDGQLCIYTNDNIYSNDPNEFERVMLEKIPSLKDTQRQEVYKYINLMCRRKGEYSNAKFLGLKDNVLDIETMETYPYSPKFVINNKIDYNYNENAYSEVMDKTLDKVACYDDEVRMLLEEMIGYSLYRENTMQMAFILTGGGSNGKSTILNLIKRLLGKQNYTSLDLRELEDTFTPSELYNKLANIGDDISAKYLETSSIFKKVVTGESFMAQRKYGQPFELESYATQIFCANELPPVNDKTDGFSRRIKLIPFTATFKTTDEDYDPFIQSKLETDESMEYLLKLAIDGLKRVLYNKKFTKSTRSRIEKNEFVKNNNPILQWLDDSPKIENEAVADVYLKYKLWCTQMGVHPVKQVNLSRELKEELDMVSVPRYIDGKTVRIYEKDKGGC